jgi:hypothetical protein
VVIDYLLLSRRATKNVARCLRARRSSGGEVLNPAFGIYGGFLLLWWPRTPLVLEILASQAASMNSPRLCPNFRREFVGREQPAWF